MNKLLEFLLQVLSQFVGGPGLMENNLVRFIIPAILWGALLVVAWNRQREQDLPREKLLVLGFGLGMVSAIVMSLFISLQILDVIEREATYAYLVPLERALAMASVLVVAGAFLRYILDNARIARLYLLVGLSISTLLLVIAFWQWPYYLATLTEEHFHSTVGTWLFEIALSILIIVAIILLRRKAGWLSTVVTIALMFFLISEVLVMANYATDKSYNRFLCPIGNSFRILAIPLLGYVYLREQSIEKKRTAKELEAYRQHLEDLVEERTAELTAVNAQLKHEVHERKLAEAGIAQRNANLAAQNTVAATLSHSLELEKILDTALDTVLSVVDMDIGLVFLQDSNSQELILHSSRGEILQDETKAYKQNWCCCQAISHQAMTSLQAIVRSSADYPCASPDSNILQQGLQMLVSVPLVSKNSAVGALTLGSRNTEPVPQSAVELLTAIGQQIGMGIENAHLYQEAERSARELTLLHQISIVLTSTLNTDRIYDQITEQSVKLLNCHMACILTWDESLEKATRIASYGMSEADFTNLQAIIDPPKSLKNFVVLQESIVIDDAQHDPRVPLDWIEQLNIRSLLCVPIQGMNESLGTLYLIDRNGTRRWRFEEQELIESFVNRAAVALTNASLCRQLEWAAALEERQRIAADMHDGLAQTVSLLGLQIEGVIELIEAKSDQQAVEDLSNIRQVVAQASVDVRRSIASLQGPPQPRRSLQDLLSEVPAQLPVGDGPAIELINQVPEPLFLPLEQRDQALLIVQEALLNAHRHAQAQHIQLILTCGECEAKITVQDDGKGFDPQTWWENGQGHFGLGIIHARAARIGARLQIDSVSDQGTCVSLILPLPANMCHLHIGAMQQETTGANIVTPGVPT